ncbi:hypothetical protein [Phytohabitans houttuyneae]|uniref:Uncharacterized protein n=1 Tax=Phytohabitans houttuyneae TaxID=1076126 RepID=A0A6V8JUP4_9ACTN|nr:hypothetical protein [Phytohabitans houttuyneae]GFJ76322.1 hypothetical protein Phou_005020 [Phytohabitans houttuyneae]
MTTRVINRERLAWDAARVVVRVLGSDQVGRWLHEQMAARLGPEPAAALVDSRLRMWASTRLDAPQVEAGIWRAKVAELLAADPSLAAPLQELMAEATERLAYATDVRVHGEVPQPPPGPRVIDLDQHRR